MDNEKETVEVEQTPGYCSEYLQKIEDERLGFLNLYKKQNAFKWVVFLLCFVLIIVAFVVVPNLIPDNAKLSSGLMLGIAALGLIGTFLYSTLMRKKLDKKMKSYFGMFYQNIYDFAFSQDGFTNIVVQDPGKINIDNFTECNLYKDIVEVGSRGLTEFVYNDIPMAIVDCAGNVKGEKRILPVFVGKYLYAASKYLDNEPITIYLKGNDKSLPPTNLDGIEKVKSEEKYEIYSNNKDWSKVIDNKILEMILDIETNDNLVDLAITIHNGKTYVLMGYDDPLMVLPLQNKFNSKPYEMFKNDLAKIVKVVEALSK